jgi:hypothetical protein
MAIQHGKGKYVFGVRDVPRVLGLPPDAVRVRMRVRSDDFIRVYVKRKLKHGHILSCHLLEEQTVGFVLGLEVANNRDLLDKRRGGQSSKSLLEDNHEH